MEPHSWPVALGHMTRALAAMLGFAVLLALPPVASLGRAPGEADRSTFLLRLPAPPTPPRTASVARACRERRFCGHRQFDRRLAAGKGRQLPDCLAGMRASGTCPAPRAFEALRSDAVRREAQVAPCTYPPPIAPPPLPPSSTDDTLGWVCYLNLASLGDKHA